MNTSASAEWILISVAPSAVASGACKTIFVSASSWTLQIRDISLGPLAFAAIGYYSSGSISFGMLDGRFREVLCQLILCASMGKELNFFIVTSDERRWGDSVIDKVLLFLSLQECRLL